MFSSFSKSAKAIAMGLCVGAIAGCASLQPVEPLPRALQQALQKAGMSEQHLGVVAFPLAGGARGLRLHANTSMQPGSTMKLVTAVVALEQLGPNARSGTDLLAATPPVGDVLPGPLYLRGRADTDLDWGALWNLLRQLREQGVRHIQGGLVVDRTLFHPARLDSGAPPFDESPEFQYNAIPDALYLSGNMVAFKLQSDANTLTASISPGLPGLRVDARAMVLVDKPCAAWEDDWKLPQVQTQPSGPVVVLQGQFPRNCRQQPELNLIDRQWVTAAAVRQIWAQLGGQIDGADAEGATPPGATVLVTHQGRPLAEVARGMMKGSDNPMARLFYLRLGAQAATADEATLDAAARSVGAWFTAKGIATEGLVMDNGSGLSRSERITPAQMASVLTIAYQGAHAPELLTGLPVAGVDGTMSRRLKGTAAEGRARLKSGTLRNAVGLGGYVLDQKDRMWVVVAFVNHDGASDKGRPVLDSVVEWVAGQQ
jgi:D-alanyl-D-alanine carboxypeptidase/D-alanyl-D-alanine-endopeptidase (penicillin-binding protein 4)